MESLGLLPPEGGVPAAALGFVSRFMDGNLWPDLTRALSKEQSHPNSPLEVARGQDRFGASPDEGAATEAWSGGSGGPRSTVHGPEPWCQKAEIRGPKSEGNPKAEIRNPARAGALRLVGRWAVEMGAELWALEEATLFAMRDDTEQNCTKRRGGNWKWLIRKWL
jgi:hypothetical protein